MRRVGTPRRRTGLVLLVVVLVGLLAFAYASQRDPETRKPVPTKKTATDETGRMKDLLTEAAAGRGTVKLSPRTYSVNQPLVVPAGVSLQGNGAVLEFHGRAGSLLTLSDGSALRDLTVRSREGAQTIITVADGATGVELSDCQIEGSGDELSGLETSAGVSGLTMTNCEVTDVKNAVQLSNGPTDVLVDDITIRHWSTRGIRIQGTSQYAASHVVIRGANVGPNVGSDESRYPIVALSNGLRHRDITVENSTVTGRDHAFDDPAIPGTADQISIINTDGAVVRDNKSLNGGERGINVSGSTDVLVEGNYVKDADTCGIGVGASPQGAGVQDVVIKDNTIIDSGRSRRSTTVDGSLAGIRLTQVSGATVSDNKLVSSADRDSQKYGITLDNSADADVKDNVFDGPMVEQIYHLQDSTGEDRG